MGITVRRAKHGKWNRERRNWLVIDHVSIINAHTFTGHTVIRTYTCTNWTDAMRIADDLANDRAIDPWRVVALNECEAS